MSETEREEAGQRIARDITFQTAHALEGGRPLFLIVYYEHEALKLAFLKSLAEALHAAGIGCQTFDPVHRPEHGAGSLYPQLAATAAGRTLALITGIPRPTTSSDQAASFLDYLNLHRDRVERDKLRLVLFLHTSEAERFMAGAGDLWDFRHHTYWLEGGLAADRAGLWSAMAESVTTTGLSDQDKEAVATHLNNTRTLIDQTLDPEEKAALFLDLSRWLTRHHCPALGAEVALTGLKLLSAGPSALRANLEYGLGYALRKNINNSDALAHYERALAIFSEIGDRVGKGDTFNNIALIYEVWGRYDEALQALEQSLAICREIGDRVGEGGTLNNIALIYEAWGSYDEALQALEQSLAICREIGDRVGEGATLNNISQICHAWGRYDEALQALKQSLAICSEIGDRAGEAVTLNNISLIYQAWGRYDEALQALEQSLAISREIGDRGGEGAPLNNIAGIYRAWGRNDEAIKALEQSLAIRREVGDRTGEGTTLNNISQIYVDWGRYDEALHALLESLAIHREIGNRAGHGNTCWNLAMEFQRRGDLAKAIEFARTSVEIREELHHPDAQQSREFLRQLEQGLAAKKGTAAP